MNMTVARLRRRGGKLVPERHDDALRGHGTHEIGHAWNLRRDVDHSDKSFRRVLETPEKREVRRMHPFDRMRPDGARFGRDERSLEEEPENRPLALRIALPRLHDNAHRRDDRLGVAGHERRQKRLGAVGGKPVRDGLHGCDGQARRIEVDACIAVHLKIYPPLHINPLK